MFRDFFDFSKKRTLREAALFCVFHTLVVTLILAGLSVLEG